MPEIPNEVSTAQSWLEKNEQDLINLTRELLKIPSVESEPEPNAPFGKANRQALDFVLQLGDSWGMATKDVEGYAGHAEFGDGEGVIMAVGHLDVVPVGQGWKHDPFGAEIDGGYIYSRGAVDDKGPTMAAFFAMRALQATGANLPTRMRMVFGCDEESGFKCVERYFTTEESPTYGIAPDAMWPLVHAEKGIANIIIRHPLPKGSLQILSFQSGERPNVVPFHAEAKIKVSEDLLQSAQQKTEEYWDKNVSFAWAGDELKIVAKGKAAHGAVPFLGDSAVTRIFRFLNEIAEPEESELFNNLLFLSHPSGVGLGIHGRDEVTQDLTSNLGIVKSDSENIEFLINVRYPVEWNAQVLESKCKSYLQEKLPQALLVKIDDNPPLYYPLDKEPVKTICKVVETELGESKKPEVMGGGTYARAIPNCVSIGTGWEGDGPAHEPDERIKVSHLLKMSKIYCHILYALSHLAKK